MEIFQGGPFVNLIRISRGAGALSIDIAPAAFADSRRSGSSTGPA
jgi:hypothetical protein